MPKGKFTRLFTVLLLLCATLVSAQKPHPVSPLEIKLAPQNERWSIVKNTRILERTGWPVAIYQADFPVTKAAPEEMARQYLSLNRAVLGLSDKDIQNLRRHAVRTDQTGSTVRLRQFWQGLPVNKNAEITVHINPSFKVDFVMNGFEYGVALADITATVTPEEARKKVASHLGITKSVIEESNQLMVLHHLNKDYLVYRVAITVDQPLGEWECFVDAKTGTLLKVEDIAAYHHEPKKNLPVPPFFPPPPTNGTGNTFDPDPLTTATATYGGSYVDGSDANAAVLTAQLKSRTLLGITLNAGTYSLVGPYAAIVDFEAPSKGLFTQASSTFAFDRSDDAFEAVNCYYHIDASMRYLNVTLGLAIAPFQYTGGVQVDPSGLSGADNSHYLGGSGKLAFGEGGVDDAEDADVIIHELGHGLHDWFTAGGLSQVNGLSEGSGDYWAASYSRGLGYWTSAQAGYNWVFNWDGHNPFWGGRVVNYGAIYPGGLVGAIHTDGQIWSTSMMHVWDDIGQQNADKIFWSGLAATNSSTNQNDAANAVYQAAINLGYSYPQLLAIHTRFTASGYMLPPLAPPCTESFVCPASQNVNLNANCAFNVPNLVSGLTSNCGTLTFTQSPTAGTLVASSHNATTNVTINASNSTSCTVVLTAKDIIPPTVMCKPALYSLNGGAPLLPSAVFQSGADNCGTVNLVSVVPNTFGFNNLGPNNVLLTINDGNGNTASCTATVQVSAIVDGKIIWKQDNITGVKDAVVALTGSQTGSVTTPLSGLYSFTLTSGNNFTITPTKNINKLNGVNAQDVFRLQQHLSGNLLTNPWQLIAADANSNGTINPLDLSIIQNSILGNPQAQAQMINSWRFVPTSHVLNNPPWGFPENIVLSGSVSNFSNLDFYGVKVGDIVAIYANPANLTPEPPFVLTAPDKALQAGDELTIDFRANQTDDLAAFQFGLHFDTDRLELSEIEPLTALPLSDANFGTYQLDKGAINVMWAGASGAAVPEAAPVFRLTFKVLESGGKLSDVLRLNEEALLPRAYKTNDAESEVVLHYLNTTGTNNPGLANNRFALLQNQPNPFVNRTTIGFVLPENCTAQLRIFDVSGRELVLRKKQYAAGLHTETFDLESASGVLYYELSTPFGLLSKKMVVIEQK